MMNIPSFREGSQGSSSLVWSASSQSWLCGDSEGSILAKKVADAEHETTKLEGEPVTAIAVHPNKDECMVAEGDSISLRTLSSLDSLIQEGIIKSNLAFTHIQFDHSGHFLFTSSMEPDVTILSMDKAGAVDQKISTSNLGVRTFSLTTDSSHIAVVDVDGSVCIHSIIYGSDPDGTRRIAQKHLETINSGIISKSATRSASEIGCKISWYPFPSENIILAVPSTSGSVVILSPVGEVKEDGERSWAESFIVTAETPSHEQRDLNIVEFSPNGKYMATADMAGVVLVWAFNSENPSQSATLHSLNSITVPIHDLVWGRNSADNYIIATTTNDWYEFPDVVGSNARPALLPGASIQSNITGSTAVDFLAGTVPTTEMSEEDALIAAAMAVEEQYQLAQQAKSPVASPSPASTTGTKTDGTSLKRLTKVSAATAADDDDGLFDDEESLPATKVKFAEPAAAAPTAEEGDATSIAAIKHTAGISSTTNKRIITDDADLNDDDDDDMDEEDNAIDNDMGGSLSLTEMMNLAKSGAMPGAVPMVRKVQPPVQPSSTKFDEKRRRYLVWNKVGSIVLREETIENRIEIRFNNTGGSNRNESFADRTGFTMGSLSYEGAVFASEPEPADEPKGSNRDPEFRKEGPGSTIYYHAFSGQKHMGGANESFRWTLSDGEAALAVAVGFGWVAVASSRNLLYIFNSAGMPCVTVALAGPVLAMSGCDAHLGIVYHGHSMMADLYEIVFQAGCRTRKLVSGISLPLPPQQPQQQQGQEPFANPTLLPVKPTEQQLEWVGFDVDHHVMTILDAQGVLWGLINCADWQWVPLLDTHQVRKSVEHKYWPTCIRNNKLVYVLLNGESRPAIYPQPVVSTRTLRVPVPCIKDGKDVGDVQKDRMHNVLWACAMTNHLEIVLAEATAAASAGKPTSEDPEVIMEAYNKLEYEADKAVLTALQEECQRQRTPLALSLALQIRTEKTLMAAITIANHFGRTVVAEALDTILENKQALAAQLEEQLEQQQQTIVMQHEPAYSSSEYAPENENLFSDNAPTFDNSSPQPSSDAHRGIAAEKHVNFDETSGGMLSGKVSQKPPLSMFGATKAVVSPAMSAGGSAEKPAAPVRNRFAVTSSGSTPQKRKNVYDGIQDMKASPSPKKPALNRQSSFSQQARQQRLSDKRIL